MIKQRMIKRIIQTIGVGLHTGKKITLVLRSAPENIGIICRRTNLNSPVDLSSKIKSVRNIILCICLINKNNI
ncbi:MAG: hypothetical protein ArsCj_5200 [Arsenophonus endosymbiont of Ceratovacuna japonica]